MRKTEFSKIRHNLGKTQRQLAQLLGISTKAVESFEQGWRIIPVHVERQLFFLLALKNVRAQGNDDKCWKIKDCPGERRNKCPAWEFQCGDLCWMISGTICQGKEQKSWKDKMNICRKCEFFISMFFR